MFEVGLPVKIRINDRDYSSKVEDLNSEYLYLSTPIEQGRLLYVASHNNLSVFFTSKGAVYNFDSSILENLSTETPPMIKIKRPQKLRKIQRRQFFRLEKKLAMQYKILDDSCDEYLSDLKTGQALDISGGGIRLATEEVIPVNTFVELSFSLNIDEGSGSIVEDITCVGQIVRTNKIESDKMTIYHYGVKFVSLPNKVQDLIVRFIFSEQRKLRQKGRSFHERTE